MSESWMPSDEEIVERAAREIERETLHYCPRGPIRTAVEKALAEEWKKSLDAKEELIRRFPELQTEQEARHKRELECPICCGSVDDSGFRCACGGSNDIRQAFEYLHGEWGRLRSELAQTEARHRREVIKAMAKQEARHNREVIEARLEELIDYGECTCMTLGGTCAAHVHENELRAELAALEVKP